MDKELNKKILFEISEIDELLSQSSILLQKCKIKDPDFIELSAIGATLHAFYNGIENIFLLIRKGVDKENFKSERWHAELLNTMFKKTDKRNPVLDDSLYEPLSNYMGFRHFFRHTYGYHLRWDLAKPLFENITTVWASIKNCFLNFIG